MSSSDVLAGKVAVISGGARGQGAEEGSTVPRRAGATVLLADVNDSDRLSGRHEAGVSYTHLDVTSEEECGHGDGGRCPCPRWC